MKGPEAAVFARKMRYVIVRGRRTLRVDFAIPEIVPDASRAS